MPGRGIFHGLRFAFLDKERKGYADAVASGAKEDFLKDLVRRFFKRFPLELPLLEEPSEDHLAAVDDSKPDPEPEAPNAKQMLPEEYDAALKKFEQRQKLIQFRTGVSYLSHLYLDMSTTRVLSHETLGSHSFYTSVLQSFG